MLSVLIVAMVEINAFECCCRGARID